MEKSDFIHNASDCASWLRGRGLHVVLVGLPGSGKSRLGRALARLLGLGFRDSDKLIEHKEHASVEEIFSARGEAYFRMAEEVAIMELLAQAPSVIATGGGAIMNPRLLEAINLKGVSIWIDADIEQIAARLKGDESRPLLKGEDRAAALRRLAAEREPYYASAHLRVQPGNAGPESAAKAAMGVLYAHAKMS